MIAPERLRYKTALVDWQAEILPTFHVIAELPPALPEDALRVALRDWAARIDRYYLGRDWASRCPQRERMAGVLFFERGKRRQWHHAHLAVRPPQGASWLHFLLKAALWFRPDSNPMF
jgi:hypothetical protein